METTKLKLGSRSDSPVVSIGGEPVPAEAQRRQFAVRGLRRMIAGATSSGRKKQAVQAEEKMPDVLAALQRIEKLEADEKIPVPNPVIPCIEAAARSLRKVLPDCFPSQSDAITFAAKLPFNEERTAFQNATKARAKLSRTRNEANKNYWKLVGDVAVIVAPNSGGTIDRATDDAIKAGSYE